MFLVQGLLSPTPPPPGWDGFSDKIVGRVGETMLLNCKEYSLQELYTTFTFNHFLAVFSRFLFYEIFARACTKVRKCIWRYLRYLSFYSASSFLSCFCFSFSHLFAPVGLLLGLLSVHELSRKHNPNTKFLRWSSQE